MKRKLTGNLRFIRLKKLWKKYSKGETVNIAVLDTDFNEDGHGKKVMSIIESIAPEANIIPFNWAVNGLSKIPETLEEINEIEMINIVNISLITGHTKRLETVIKKLYDRDVHLIAASGNDSKNSFYPAQYTDYVTSVGSLWHKSTKKSGFTSPGYELLAPGEIENIGVGTSYAAPHVAAIAACMLGKKKMSPDELEKAIIQWMNVSIKKKRKKINKKS